MTAIDRSKSLEFRNQPLLASPKFNIRNWSRLTQFILILRHLCTLSSILYIFESKFSLTLLHRKQKFLGLLVFCKETSARTLSRFTRVLLKDLYSTFTISNVGSAIVFFNWISRRFSEGACIKRYYPKALADWPAHPNKYVEWHSSLLFCSKHLVTKIRKNLRKSFCKHA